jgi:LmbE family N-acetylglucosaminyl deacetylase
MKDITILQSHCDDEALFLWPFLDRVKRIVCASSDRYNPERQWCKERGDCLAEVCKLLGCELTLLDNFSEFYRKPTRDGQLKAMANTILEHLHGAEIVATHNGWGEYGHLDHILLHQIARTYQARSGCNVLVTDINQEINWLPIQPWCPGNLLVMNGEQSFFRLDRPLFDRIKEIYDAKGCWTWSWEPQETCGVYEL